MELDQSLTEGLPFDPRQQDAIVGYAVTDIHFFLSLKDRVETNWFIDGWTGKTYGLYRDFFKVYGHTPKSDDEFMLYDAVFRLPPLERQKVKNTLLRCRNEINSFSLDVLQSALTGWMQSRVYHKYVSQSATLFNNRKFTEAKSVLSDAVKELAEISFEGKPPADFSNPRALIQEIQVNLNNALTLGHPVLDKALNPDCPKGSLIRGDATILLAPTNIGKTTAKVSMLCANLWQGKSCIFITHEGRKNDLMEKIWQCMLGITKADFRMLGMSDKAEHKAIFDQIGKILAENLVYIDYQKPGSTVEEVVSMVRQHQQRRKAKYGHGFDLFCNDYPAILGAEGLKNIRVERRQKDAYVYRYLVDYAGEQEMHGLYSIQTNREGSKKNRKSNEFSENNQLVLLEDVQEAYEVTNSATNLITINRSPEEQVANIITYLICKSRSSEVNVAVTCKSDFRIARTHWADQPAAWYHGTNRLDELQTLLMQFKNSQIPHNYKDYINAPVAS